MSCFYLAANNPVKYNDLLNLTYSYDLNGNITQIVDGTTRNDPNHQTQTFGYDALNRLTSAQRSGGDGKAVYGPYTYTYDSATGNLANKGETGAFSYQDASHKHAVTHIDGSLKYQYDANGNMTSRPISGIASTLTYDAENHLVEVSGGASATFVYDGDGSRVQGDASGVTTAYLGKYLEYNGSVIAKYYLVNGEPVAKRTGGGGEVYLLGDHLNSLTIVAGSAFTLQSERRYSAWGEMTIVSGTATNNTFAFTDQRREKDIDLLFYQARWYDNTLGRFTTPDTVIPQPFDPPSYDRYMYVRNSPPNFNDPSGHMFDDGRNNTDSVSCWGQKS